jgi:hypothetical protein
MATTVPHRGTDIGKSLGAHLHAGIAPSINTVKAWANDIATVDNDIIQLRKKNGILYVMKVVPHTSNSWEKLDPKDVPVITDVHGAKLEDVDLAILRDELVLRVEPEEIKPIPYMEIGWYQDQKADLFYYEGEGHWREVDLKTNKKLTEMVITGTLEFIG